MKQLISYTAALAIIAGIFMFAQPASAINPEVLLTWQADTFVPPGYVGKVLPTRNTNVALALEVIEDGRVANLVNAEIRWYLNNKLFTSGKNLKQTSFNTNTQLVSSYQVRVVIIGYGNSELTKTITIPLTAPIAVIDAPYPERTIAPGQHPVSILPYFFTVDNLSDISVVWTVENQTFGAVDAANSRIVIDTTPNPDARSATIAVTTTNIVDPFEVAKSLLTLTIKTPQ